MDKCDSISTPGKHFLRPFPLRWYCPYFQWFSDKDSRWTAQGMVTSAEPSPAVGTVCDYLSKRKGRMCDLMVWWTCLFLPLCKVSGWRNDIRSWVFLPNRPTAWGWGWSGLHLMAVPLWPCISTCTSSFPAYSFSSNRSTNHSPHWYLLGALKFCGENTMVMWKWFQDDRCYLCAFFGSFSPKRSQT